MMNCMSGFSGMMPDAIIHLRVSAARKGRWVRASRSAGLRLTDWIIKIVEKHMANKMLARITIPDDVRFSDLRLARDADGMISFDWSPIERICSASGVDIALLRDGAEDNVSALVVAWYAEHLRNGGERDPVQDDLIAEMMAEDAAGQHHSLPPGRA